MIVIVYSLIYFLVLRRRR